MESKELNIRKIRQGIGWVYPELKWLTGKEAKLADKKRDDLLKSLSNEVNYSFMQSKIHIGPLSPGCVICGEGYWSCMFINGLCTANCFYCPQDRKIKKEKSPSAEIIFDDPEDYAAYLKKFNFKGVGFSGGETLLVFKRLLTFIKKIREKLGKDIYLWIYTNGDLVNEDKLIRLKKSGLAEIRFNISASNYDLRPVELAANIINTVTVEIPSIPEDYEIVKGSLAKMQRTGVKYLNLHQLNTTPYNYKNFIDRGYTFLHQPGVSIFESEISALKLIKYALDKRIDLPINYCSSIYKNRFQGMGKRGRKAPLVKEGFEELTNSKYIRRLSIKNSPANIKRIVKILQENKCQPKLRALNDTKTEIFIHGALLKYIDFKKVALTISYFAPSCKDVLGAGETAEEIKLDSGNNRIFIKKELIAQQELSNPVTINSFKKLLIENQDEREVLKYFYKNYNLKTKEKLNDMQKETELLLSLKTWEHIKVGFPKIY